MELSDRAVRYTTATLQQLEAERAAKEISRLALSHRLNMNYQVLTRYLKGERDLPLPILATILEALGVDEIDFARSVAARMAGIGLGGIDFAEAVRRRLAP